MAKDKKTSGVDASEEVVNAFEAGIVFGRMVESRRPTRHPLWSEDECVLVKRDPLQVWMAERVRELAQQEFSLRVQDAVGSRCILFPTV
jgi:hypothetical protein